MSMSSYNVESMQACENGPRKRDGAYVCYLHHLVGAGVRRTEFKMGNANPLQENLNDLVGELQARLPFEYKFLRDKVVPIKTFIGLSIVRHCARSGHGAGSAPKFPDTPRTERVAGFAFAKEPIEIIDIKQHPDAQLRTISLVGLGSALRAVGSREMTAIKPLIHLPVTAQGKDRLAANEAVATFPSMGRASDPFVALHSLAADMETAPLYLEQIIPRSTIELE